MSIVKEGEQAPDFSLPNQDGSPIKLSSLTGTNILMWWYPKADTPGWTIEGQGFRDRINEFNNKNCIVLGVSFDPIKDNKAFKDKFR